jgi:hypothetical protein
MRAVRPTFDNIVNAVLLAVCLVLGASATLQLIDRLRGTPAATAPDAAYQPGDVVPALDGYSYSSADATLILAVRSTCAFCTQSMPFYARLAEEVSRSKGAVTLVGISSESTEAIHQYFGRHDIKLESVRSVPINQFRIPGTPTLVLVNRSGVVEGAWIGALDAEREAVVLSAVKQKSRSQS